MSDPTRRISIPRFLWGLYTISVFIATIVFLQTNIKGHENTMPSVNPQLFMFLYASYYIMLGIGTTVTVGELFFSLGVTSGDSILPSELAKLNHSRKGHKKKDWAYPAPRVI